MRVVTIPEFAWSDRGKPSSSVSTVDMQGQELTPRLSEHDTNRAVRRVAVNVKTLSIISNITILQGDHGMSKFFKGAREAAISSQEPHSGRSLQQHPHSVTLTHNFL
jgi:hypothetical protein